MKRRDATRAGQRERELAIGLVWGHLSSRQFESAWQLATGCLHLWPDDVPLQAMLAYAGLELFDDPANIERVRRDHGRYGAWGALLLHRAEREALHHAG